LRDIFSFLAPHFVFMRGSPERGRYREAAAVDIEN